MSNPTGISSLLQLVQAAVWAWSLVSVCSAVLSENQMFVLLAHLLMVLHSDLILSKAIGCYVWFLYKVIFKHPPYLGVNESLNCWLGNFSIQLLSLCLVVMEWVSPTTKERYTYSWLIWTPANLNGPEPLNVHIFHFSYTYNHKYGILLSAYGIRLSCRVVKTS